MALVSEYLKKCGAKISVSVCGVPSYGSGIVYVTPNYCDYNYVLTAKHVLQEDSQTPFDITDVVRISISCFKEKDFKVLQIIKGREIRERIVDFENDLVIIKVDKRKDFSFELILISDQLDDDDIDFFSWGVFSANLDQLQKFDFQRNDPEMNRYSLISQVDEPFLPGMSGAGIFANDKNVLYGIVSRYPNEEFQNGTIDFSFINVSIINAKLSSLGWSKLDSKSSKHKREVNGRVIDIHQAYINGVCLDLEKARKRLEYDMRDDWFHDPLMYIDLLKQDYLFEQFDDYFNGAKYVGYEAERFYVPKKKLTLRLSLVSPFVDRVVYMSIVGVLADQMDKAMISNIYSARYNRFSKNQLIINGVEQWKKMTYKLDECANLKNSEGEFVFGCVIEVDLLNFYDNINKRMLIDKLYRVCKTPNEKRATLLLESLLKKFSVQDLGLPQNSDASSLLASFYLNQVDVFMEHNVPEYYRFMDDIRIFCSDKYEARKILQTLEFELRRCHLAVNSQKTEIFSFRECEVKDLKDGEKSRMEYNELFDIKVEKIARLRKSNNYAYTNDAFHASVELLKENLSHEDVFSSGENARKLNFALNTLAALGKRDINLYSNDSNFMTLMIAATSQLKNKPWISTQVYHVLNLVHSSVIIENFFSELEEIVLNDKYNTYAFQTYKTWLLLAKHKCVSRRLKQYAIKQIEKNDETNRPVIAAMVIYMCSIDKNYSRVVIRKFKEGFTHGYFQNRLAMISMRAFDDSIVAMDKVDLSLDKSFRFTNQYGHKDLVFVQGFHEDSNDSEEDFIEQLYSI